MARRKSTDFNLRFDDEDPDSIYRSEMDTLKIEKLGQRVTLLTILIPCLIGVILVYGYMDIKDRLTKTSYTGTQGVEKLSRELESRFSSLSVKQARLEETLAAQAKTLDDLKKQIKNNAWHDKKAIQKVAESVNTRAEKKDLKALGNKVSRIDKSVSPLGLEISSANVKLEALDTRTTGELAKLSQKTKAMEASIEQFKTESGALETEIRAQLSQKVNSVALKNHVDEAIEPLNTKVNDLLRRVGLLQMELSTLTKGTNPKTDEPETEKPSAEAEKIPAEAEKTPTTDKTASNPPLKKAMPKTKPTPDKKIEEQELNE